MASTRFIFQGFTPDTHVEALREVLAPGLDRTILSVAYVSDAGVRLISDLLAPHAGKIEVFAGIRNEITSRQGLERLLELGVRVVAVDTGSSHLAYHPKLYYGRGSGEAKLIVGSANLTTGGLNNNVEASVSLRLDLHDREDSALAGSVEGEFDKLERDYPIHVANVASAEDLTALYQAGRLIDEVQSQRPRITRLGGKREGDVIPLISLKVERIKTVIATKAPVEAKAPAPAGVSENGAGFDRQAQEQGPQEAPSEALGASYQLVWESKPLTERDLTIPRGMGTNQTGSMNLDKGLLAEEIDHRHYFRDQVFEKLAWSARSNTVDEASAVFQAVVKGNAVGAFKLAIRHTTSTDTASYEQRNAMTRLSWGDLRPYIQSKDLLDRTARLYRSQSDPTDFLIEID